MSTFKVGDRVRSLAYPHYGDMTITETGEYDNIWIGKNEQGMSGGFSAQDLQRINLTPETRALALIRRIADGMPRDVAEREARAIMKDVEPDGDLIEARKIAAECEDAPYGTLEDVALATIRRGRALERTTVNDRHPGNAIRPVHRLHDPGSAWRNYRTYHGGSVDPAPRAKGEGAQYR